MIRSWLLWPLPFLLALGCAGEPVPRSCPSFGDAGVVNPPQMVQDTYLQEVIELYQISLVKNVTLSGKGLTCDQIPGTYAMSNLDLDLIFTTPYKRPAKDSKPVVVPGINFPVGPIFLVVAEGVAQGKGGTYLVARGCEGPFRFETCNPIPVGLDRHIEIDLIATTGAPCKGQNQGCEANMICMSDVQGGYCAKANCLTDHTCPPATVCIPNATTVGACMRGAANIGDCKIGKQKGTWNLTWRTAADGTCQRVCAPINWNTAYACTP